MRSAAGHDARVHLLGGVYDQDLLDQLYAGALCYLHGHSVGGTNPSLLRAMGAGTAVLAWEVSFNREVAAERGRYFDDDSSLAALIEAVEAAPTEAQRDGVALREIVRTNYRWDDVAVAYEALAGELSVGRQFPRAGTATRARRAARNQEPHDRVLAGRCAREAPLSTRIGYAGGAFDLFHVGHLNILRHAKANCDFLIAGVVTDEMLLLTKGVAAGRPVRRAPRDRPPHLVRRRRARRDRARQARHVAGGRVRRVLQGRRLARNRTRHPPRGASSPRSASRSCTSPTPCTRRAPRSGSRCNP